MPNVSSDTISRLIGSIYDCAIDPERWLATMGEISAAARFMSCVLLVVEVGAPIARFHKSWGIDPADLRHYETEYADDPTAIFLHSLANPACDPDEPVVFRQVFDDATLSRSRVFQDWTSRLGMVNSIATVALQAADRIGIISGGRHRDVGLITDHEIAMMRLLAPHVRRAVTISDLLDMRAIEAKALTATLDALPVGVVLVGADARILHANTSAEAMFESGSAISSIGGRLMAAEPHRAQPLADAISRAGLAGSGGAAVRLDGPEGAPTLAHVLPLSLGDTAKQLMPRAMAAVFITTAGARRSGGALSTVADTFGLTAGEGRVLQHVASGASTKEAAVALGISENTAKTHLSRIFEKTGVSRQAELVALLARLTPPIR